MKKLILTVLFLYSMGEVLPCHATEPQTAERFQPAYVASTNGMFAICQFNPEHEVLLRWKGICIASNDLPQAGPNRPILIFDNGTRPPIDRSKSGMIRTPKGFYHHYGKIPYPIKDIDPPLEYSLDMEGNLLIGFSLRERFYAVTPKKPLFEHIVTKKYWSKVIQICLPFHRTNDLNNIKQKLTTLKQTENDFPPPSN